MQIKPSWLSKMHASPTKMHACEDINVLNYIISHGKQALISIFP